MEQGAWFWKLVECCRACKVADWQFTELITRRCVFASLTAFPWLLILMRDSSWDVQNQNRLFCIMIYRIQKFDAILYERRNSTRLCRKLTELLNKL